MTTAYTIESGPGGLEVMHKWQDTWPINDSDRANGFVKLTGITGIHGIGDAPENSTPNQGRRGSTPLPRQTKGRTITYTGITRGRNLEAVRRCQTRMDHAFRDVNTEGTMFIGGGPLGGPTWFFKARPQMLDQPDEQKGGVDYVHKWDRDFTLQLQLYDPRIYCNVPQLQGGTGTVVLTNPGKTDTDPVFAIPSFAGGNLELRNAANNRTLRAEGIPAGSVIVDFYSRSLKIDGVDKTGYITPDSDWWDESVQGLLPGNNSVVVYGSSGVTPAWTSLYYPAV